MATSDDKIPAALLSAARREYERSRWRGALALVWFVVPMMLVAVDRGASLGLAMVNATALAMLSAWLLWRGEAYGAAVLPGILAGAVPFLTPMVVHRGAHLCALGSCMLVGSTLFFATGLVGGAVLSFFTLRRHAGQRTFLLAGVAVAAVTGLFGCTHGGYWAVPLMIAGFLLLTAPAMLRLRSQRAG